MRADALVMSLARTGVRFVPRRETRLISRPSELSARAKREESGFGWKPVQDRRRGGSYKPAFVRGKQNLNESKRECVSERAGSLFSL